MHDTEGINCMNDNLIRIKKGQSNAKIGPTELIYEEWKGKIKRRLRNK